MAMPDYIDNLETWKKEFTYYSTVTVRFSDTDAFGHMNNTKAFVYFEHARLNFFKEIGLAEEWFIGNGSTVNTGENIPVTADLHCNYVKQIFFDEEIRIFVKAAHIGRTSVDLHYMALNEKDEIVLTGRGRMVQVSKKDGRPTPWSDYALQCLKKSHESIVKK